MNQVSTIATQKKNLLNLDSFRRVQLTILVWGLILITGGYLHNNFASSKAWGAATMFCVWVGLTVFGLVINYLLAPGFLNSGSIFTWFAILLVALFTTWLILFPLNMEGKPFVSTIWHLAMALGYFITGYYFDRRLFFLALWEITLAVIMYLLVVAKVIVISDITNNLGYTLGFSSGIPLLICALPFWKERRPNFSVRKGRN